MTMMHVALASTRLRMLMSESPRHRRVAGREVTLTVDAVASSSHSAHKMYAAIELRFPFQMAHLQLIPSLWGCVKLN